MAARVLSTLTLNRALLARQLLLERSTVSLPRALERVGGLQMQYAPSGYVGLWSRVEGFRRESLTRALERRRVVQGTLMRSTIHLVSAGDYPRLAEAIRDDRRQWWTRTQRTQLARVDMDAAARWVRDALADGPRKDTELAAGLGDAGFPRIAWNGVGLWVDLVRVPPSGTWERRRANLYALAEQWVGVSNTTRDTAIDLLVRRYLGGFGPAAVADIANWAGVRIATVQRSLEHLPLRRFRGEDGTELVDVRRAPLPAPDTPAPVRFLPTWDATLLVHARRTQILPEDYRPLVFHTRNPQSVPTFLVDGAVAGTWRYDDGRVVTSPFAPLPTAVRRAVDDEARRLAAFHA